MGLLPVWPVELADIWDLSSSCKYHPTVWLVILKCNVKLIKVKFETKTKPVSVSFETMLTSDKNKAPESLWPVFPVGTKASKIQEPVPVKPLCHKPL